MSSSEAPDAATAEAEKMEEVHDSMAVAIAERYLTDAVKNFHDWGARYAAPEDEIVDLLDGEDWVVRLIEIILEYAKKTEDALLRVGVVADMDFKYTTALRLTEDGAVISGHGVSLDSDNWGWFVVEMSADTVRRIAHFCRKRLLFDRIRVYAQLVHYFNELRGHREDEVGRFPGEYFSGFAMAIELLAREVGEYWLLCGGRGDSQWAAVKQDQEVS
jgi:hypothetical protein